MSNEAISRGRTLTQRQMHELIRQGTSLGSQSTANFCRGATFLVSSHNLDYANTISIINSLEA